MTTQENHHFLAGVLKTVDGKQFFINPETGLVELSKENSSLISISQEGILGMGTCLIDLIFHLNGDTLGMNVQHEGPEKSFTLTCYIDEKSGIRFHKDDIVYIFSEDPKTNSLKFLPFDKSLTPIDLVLEEKNIPSNFSSAHQHQHCCSVKRPTQKTAAMWNDLGHHEMVSKAIEYFKTHHTGTLAEVWNNKDFTDELYRGLKDADYVNPYNDGGTTEGAWRSHFFDPATRKNYRGETDRTAYTEGLKYYHLSSSSSTIKDAGYNLGLALHYYTDLTQPCHSANFAEVYGLHYPDKWPFTMVHSFFEKVGDGIIAKEPPAVTQPVVFDDNASIEKLYVDTAVISKAIFQKLITKAPDLEYRLTYIDEINSVLSPLSNFLEKMRNLNILLSPYVKEALNKGLEQSIKFLNKWNKDYVQAKPSNHYLKMWTANPKTYVETWIGYCGLGSSDGYASFLNEDPSKNNRILKIQFVDLHGKVVDPMNYTDPVYMIAVNHPNGRHILQGYGNNGRYCYWRPLSSLDNGYKLQVYPSNIIAGKWGIKRAWDDASMHKSGDYYLTYASGTDDSSITIEFIPA